MLRSGLLVAGLALASGQQVGDKVVENHPQLNIQTCTKAGGCTDAQKSVVIDSNWRWVHTVDGKNCYTGNKWDTEICPDGATCAKNCAVEGADKEYKETYGVNAEGSQLQLNFVTKGPTGAANVGSRNYLLDTEDQYYMFKLKNREFTFDADVSQLPCGLNGALYFVQMPKDGGLSDSGNKAGAKYGVGYCDAQCPHDLKFIKGEANVEGWNPSPTDPNSGKGQYGSCCVEMDIWEANSQATAFTAHSCSVTELTRCENPKDCGDNPNHRFDGVCDKNGCDFQTYRLGDKNFFGEGSSFTIDTTKPVTVVTQFVTEDGTDTGKLSEIRRSYVQGGKKIETPTLKVGSSSFNSLSPDMCKAEVGLFNDHTNFLEKGGFTSMDNAMEQGMVLVMSLWDDHDVDMLWLDSTYPTDGKGPGVARGPCSTSSGDPKTVESQHADANVKFSNIKFGEIGSTTGSSPAPGPAPGPSPGPSPSGCPGGSLSECMKMCPSDPAAFKACVGICEARCKSSIIV